MLGNMRGLEIGHDHIEHRSIAGLGDIAREHIRQPEVRVARLGALADAGAAVRRAMPPFQHVALEKLLAGVQHDLRAREARFDQDQRQHVLQLVTIAGRAAALVGADASEQS